MLTSKFPIWIGSFFRNKNRIGHCLPQFMCNDISHGICHHIIGIVVPTWTDIIFTIADENWIYATSCSFPCECHLDISISVCSRWVGKVCMPDSRWVGGKPCVGEDPSSRTRKMMSVMSVLIRTFRNSQDLQDPYLQIF